MKMTGSVCRNQCLPKRFNFRNDLWSPAFAGDFFCMHIAVTFYEEFNFSCTFNHLQKIIVQENNIAISPLVSVAMATYNGAHFIREQLDSIIGQTYSPLEIIIVDDGSKDDTIAIIKEYQKKYSNINLYQNKTNTGVTKAFEKAISYCKGEFIALSDQDDIWELNKLEILLRSFDTEDAVYSNSQLVDDKGKSLGVKFDSLMNLQSYYSGDPFLMGNCIPGHTIVMKTGFASTLSPFPQHIMFDRWIGFCAAACNGIRYVDMPLVKYRQHDNNAIGTGRSNQKKKKSTAKEQFDVKLGELKAMTAAPIKNLSTQKNFTRDDLSVHASLEFKA